MMNIKNDEKKVNKNMKYILVTGGVISGIGKGIVASSFGAILKSCGLKVTSIKIDPYINIDAGTFSPYEHGEVYVLDDGGEVDLDLGNYERFLDVTLGKDNNITTGKIYQQVIERERKGEYLGKTVQVVPHITDAIQEWVEKVANEHRGGDSDKADVCIIELGGTVGDIEGMPFVEAFRQFQFRVKKENFCLVHISLVPQPKSTGEAKTKPTQASIRELRSLGLSPDMIVCRSEKPINQTVKDKISNFCHVQPEEVVCIHDLPSIYQVPILMKSLGIIPLFKSKLNLSIEDNSNNEYFQLWKNMTVKADKLLDEIRIAIVGKYTKLEDSYVSVSRALQHAALHSGYRVNIEYIDADKLEENKLKTKEGRTQYLEAELRLIKCGGVVVPGGFGIRGVEGKIAACKLCREKKIPFLGICMGFQAAVIEFARNVLNIKNAHSYEFEEEFEENEGKHEHVIIDMPEHTKGDKGGTMRLGAKNTYFKSKLEKESVLYVLYGKKKMICERHRHRYEVNPEFIDQLEEKGLHFVATNKLDEELELSGENPRMEIMELGLKNHPYYVGTQFHPEYTSRPLRPSPPFLGLILATCNKLDSFLASN